MEEDLSNFRERLLQLPRDKKREAVREYAKRMRNSAIFKRLGWCLERVGLLDRYEFVFSGVRLGSGYSKLAPLAPRRGKHDQKWKLLINYEIDPRRWES